MPKKTQQEARTRPVVKGSARYTARGTRRLTSKERSEAIKRSWETRRAKTGAEPKPQRSAPDPKLSRRQKRVWRQRFKEGVATPKAPRRLLSLEERREVAKAAAEQRQKRERKRLREEADRLGLPRYRYTAIRKALAAEAAARAERKRKREERAAKAAGSKPKRTRKTPATPAPKIAAPVRKRASSPKAKRTSRTQSAEGTNDPSMTAASLGDTQPANELAI